MSNYRKFCLIGLAILVLTAAALYLWNAILESNLRPIELPYVHPAENEYVREIALDPKGNTWVYSIFGISVYDDQAKVLYEFTEQNTSALAYTKYCSCELRFSFDRWGRTWLIVRNQLYEWDNEKWTSYPEEFLTLQDSEINSIAFDSQGRVWIGTDNKGLVVVDSRSVTNYYDGNSDLADNDIQYITVDSKDRIWVATRGGVNIIDGTHWQTLDHENSSLLSDYVNSISFDKGGRAWIGTAEGLSIYDGQTWQNYTSKNSGVVFEDIESVVFDHSGRAWISTVIFSPGSDKIEGFTVFDGGHWRYLIIPNQFYNQLRWYELVGYHAGNFLVQEKNFSNQFDVSRAFLIPEDMRLMSRGEVYLNRFIASGGLLLLLAILVMIDLTVMFKAWWTLGINLGFAAVTLGCGAIAAPFGMLGGLIGQQSRHSRRAEIIGNVIGLIVGILVTCFLFLMLVSMNFPPI